jgi:hypothetical protein
MEKIKEPIMNLQQMMKQAQQMQKKMDELQEKLSEEEAEGSSGGGMVTITLSGKSDLKKLHIDKSIIDPEEKEMLEDLILAAFNDAKDKIEKVMREKMEAFTQELGLPPGTKLPF